MNPNLIHVDPASLRPNPWNSNHVAPDNEVKLRASIAQRGLIRPILARQTATGLEILGGEHRWRIATDLGLVGVPVLDFGAISDDEAKKIGLLDNTRYGEDDASELAVLLRSLGDLEDFQETMPFSDEAITSIFSSSSIALDDLDLIETESETEAAEEVAPAVAAPKTHAMMRFQVPLADAERLTDLITRVAKRQGFESGTALMNAGDALCFLLLAGTAPTPAAEDDAPEGDDSFGAPL